MIFFDFLHYRIATFYAGFKEKGAVSSAAGIVGGFQATNVMIGVMLYMLTQKHKIIFEKWLVLVIFFVFQIYTYIRYIYKEDHSIEVLEKAWLNKTASYRKQMSIALFMYGTISILGVLGLAIYLGSRDK